MVSKLLKISLVLLMAGVSFGAENISSGKFSVNLTPEFPGVSSYSFDGNTMQLPTGKKVVELNGKPFSPSVKFNSTSKETAEYMMTFAEIGVTLTMKAKVSPEALSFTITEIAETSDFMVKTIEIPGMVLLSGGTDNETALSNFPKASYASEKPEHHDIFDTVANITTDRFRNKNARGEGGASYAFVSNGKISTGLYSNVMDEDLRMIVTVKGDGKDKTISVAPGKWLWREVSFLTTLPPQVKLIVATDNNGDGKATWQDAAIAYRRNTPKAYKAGTLKKHPIAHIAMNFGSQATNPFYRVLDNAKKIWLYTDGLGQHIQFKGYQSEGHDSSHPDYGGNIGRRQGGRDALNYVMRRGHDFGVLSGVHINAQEYHKEAKNFSYDIANMNSIGWSWLDESYHTDYRYDSAFGTLYPRLEEMRADMPWQDFVYLDVYYGRGWPGWRMHTKTNDLGIIQFTEFPGVMERAVVWNHVANDWTQSIGGKGDRSAIARFIYYSDKDTFKHEPLLRGTNCDGFMGWHAEQDMLRTIKSAFTVNLPTKFLQHFLLIKQDENSAMFDNGVKVTVEGKVSNIYGPDGQLISSCVYEKAKTRPSENLVFIPWCPTSEEKIYHWNDKGGESQWDLPRSWSGAKSALLYRLTDLGRVFEKEIAVVDGKVTLSGIKADKPYVLYKDKPASLPEMNWSEGSLVADTGFDSHSFRYWKTTGDEEIKFVNNNYGQTELVMGSKGGKVSQVISGLEAGSTYAASVWVSIKDKQPATITVKPYVPMLKMPAINKETWKIVETSSGDGKKAIDDNGKTYWHTAYGKTTPKHPHEIVIDFGKMLTLEGFVQTARTDMHNGVIKDFKVLVSKDGKSWKTAVKNGTFEYEGTKAEVRFKNKIDARFFKLIALSEHKDGPWATLAELDMIGTAAADKDKQEIAEVSKTINRTVLTNYTDQSSKYRSKWHRIKVLFDVPAGVDSAEVVLTAGKGTADSSVYFDDVRVVKSGRSKPAKSAKNVVLFEDFENVDEGWGPFMYGWQGPMNTHLSETNLPYTNDTIGGEFSLKTRSENHTGIIYRTVSATLELKANTKYRVSFEYLSDTAERYTFVAGSDDAGQESTIKSDLAEGVWKRTKATVELTTGPQSDWFIGVHKNSKDKGTLVIDNLLVEKIK